MNGCKFYGLVFVLAQENVEVSFNPIQDGEPKSPSPLPAVTSTHLRISPQILLTFSFHLFATLV